MFLSILSRTLTPPPGRKVETEEALDKTPQAGGSVIKSIRFQELFSTPSLYTAAKKTMATHEGAKEKAKAPSVGMDLTATQWDCWRSRWAAFKHHNTRPHDPWDCLSPQLRTAAYALSGNITIGEKRFLKDVRKLVITNTIQVTIPFHLFNTNIQYLNFQCIEAFGATS